VAEVEGHAIPAGKKSERHTFGILSGAVRFLLAWTLMIVLLYMVVGIPDWQNNIPLTIVISLNVALLYYGIKPENVLPSSLVHKDEIEKPSTKTLLKNFPNLYEFIRSLKECIINQIISLEDLISDIYSDLNVLLIRMSKLLDDMQQNKKALYSLTKESINNTRKDVIKKHDHCRQQIENLRKGINNMKPSHRFQNPLDVLAFIIIAIVVCVIITNFPGVEDDFVVQVLAGSTFAIIAVSAGSLFKSALFSAPYNDKVQELYDNLKQTLDGLEKDLESKYRDTMKQIDDIDIKVDSAFSDVNKLITTLDDGVKEIQIAIITVKDEIINKLDEIKSGIESSYQEFLDSNFLDDLPQDLSALLSLGGITFLFYFGIIGLPIAGIMIQNVKDSYAVILWHFAYYFGTKK